MDNGLDRDNDQKGHPRYWQENWTQVISKGQLSKLKRMSVEFVKLSFGNF